MVTYISPYVWATMYGLTNNGYSKCSGPNNVSKEDVFDDENETFDAPEEFVGHIPDPKPKDVHMKETWNSTYRKNTTILRQKVDTVVQTERDYRTSSGEHRDRGKRLYRRSESPTNYYSQTVSINAMPKCRCFWYCESHM